MNRRLVGSIVAAVVLFAGAAVEGQAQYVAYYSPAPIPAYTAFSGAAPQPAFTAYYAPAPVYTVAMPVTYAAGACAAPAPVATVALYRPPVVGYAPATRVVTRYRPILGGTVSRVRTGFVPVVY